MNCLFRERFLKDLSSIHDKKLLKSIKEIILTVENASSIIKISNVKKLKGSKTAYRIKIGDHRIGLFVENGTAEFVRVLHRRDIYRYFPI